MHRSAVTHVPTSPRPHACKTMAIMPLCSNIALTCRVDKGRMEEFVSLWRKKCFKIDLHVNWGCEMTRRARNLVG